MGSRSSYAAENVKAITGITYLAEQPSDYWQERGYSRYDGISYLASRTQSELQLELLLRGRKRLVTWPDRTTVGGTVALALLLSMDHGVSRLTGTFVVAGTA